MRSSAKTLLKYTNQITWCIATAAATAAGTTLWNNILKPKVLDAMDAEQEAHKHPIGFRID